MSVQVNRPANDGPTAECEPQIHGHVPHGRFVLGSCSTAARLGSTADVARGIVREKRSGIAQHGAMKSFAASLTGCGAKWLRRNVFGRSARNDVSSGSSVPLKGAVVGGEISETQTHRGIQYGVRVEMPTEAPKVS